MVDRMFTVIEKGCWQPSPETVARLKQVQTELVPAVAAENEAVAKRAEAQPGPDPSISLAANARATPAAKPTPVVSGHVLEEKPRAENHSRANGKTSPFIPLAAGLVGLALIAFGWWREGH
jgi:hypothetical protein